MDIRIKSLSDTENIGKIIGKILSKGDVLCLDGDLGAGKTTLTQSIAKSLGIAEYVTSPTFTIIKEYDGLLPLYHMDVYRIDSDEDMYDLGYEEYIYSDGVTVIEWSEKIKNMLPENKANISIKAIGTKKERLFSISGKGDLCEKLKRELIKYENSRD